MTDISHARAVAIDRRSSHRFCVVAWHHRLSCKWWYHVGRLVEFDGQSYVRACLDSDGELQRYSSQQRAFEKAKALAYEAGGRVVPGIFEEVAEQALRPVKIIP